MKIVAKIMSTAKIFMTSHRLLEMVFRYLSSCVCADSTLASVSSTFSSMRTAISPCSCTCAAHACTESSAHGITGCGHVHHYVPQVAPLQRGCNAAMMQQCVQPSSFNSGHETVASCIRSEYCYIPRHTMCASCWKMPPSSTMVDSTFLMIFQNIE